MVALSDQTGTRIAEVGFLLLLIAGIWIVAAELLGAKFKRFRIVVAGTAIAAAGLLLIIATHWGHFG